MPTLEICLTFEPSHGSPAWVVQAYEHVVPIRHRTTSEGAERRPLRRNPKRNVEEGGRYEEHNAGRHLRPCLIRAARLGPDHRQPGGGVA